MESEAFGPKTLLVRRVVAVVAFALLGTFLLITRLQPSGPLLTRTFVDVSTSIVPLAAGVVSYLRARILPAPRRYAWFLIAAGSSAWGLGNVGWTYLELWAQRGVPFEERSLPFPSIADAGYALFIPFMVAAVLAMIAGTVRVTTRLRTLLDGLLIASSILFVAWAAILRPIVAYAGQQETLAAHVLALLYPLGDFLIFSLLLLLASRSPPALRATLAWLGSALLAFTAADVGFWYFTATGTYETGSLSDAGWLAAFLLLLYAALRPIPYIADVESPRPGVFVSVLPLIPFALAVIVAMVVEVREGSLEPFLFWQAVVVIGLLATRQLVAVLENINLRREVEMTLAGLRASEEERSRTLRAISHDLQNPLTPLKIQLQLLRTDQVPNPEARAKSWAIMARSLAQVQRLANDLSDIVRIKESRLNLHVAEADVAQVVRETVQSYEATAEGRGIRFHAEFQGPLIAPIDAQRVGQVLDNLATNAMKFTPTGGQITVRGTNSSNLVRVEVQDTGRGLTDVERMRLFQPFSQVHDLAVQSPADRGSGLGLFISRSLIEAHGGRMGVKSDGPGRGSTFWFELPTHAFASKQ